MFVYKGPKTSVRYAALCKEASSLPLKTLWKHVYSVSGNRFSDGTRFMGDLLKEKGKISTWVLTFSTLPTETCNMVLRCRRRMWFRIVIQQQNARSKKPRSLFPESIHLIAIDLKPNGVSASYALTCCFVVRP
ncbi:hypothetical protein TNCV_21541 [Trichonephila clavipes]|nr:hypothetical protein TNCV_21541 [Trichonephila clavipes]